MRRSEEQLVREVWKRAPEYYTDLAYHNFGGHITSVLAEAERLAEVLAELNVEINLDAVLTAILLHDAGFHENHEFHGHPTKEDLSVVMANDLLKQLGASDDFILEVVSCIAATKADATPTTNNEKLVRLADVSNVYHEPGVFLASTVNYAEERVFREVALKPTLAEQFNADADFLGNFFGELLVFIDREGNEVILDYFDKANANIRLLREIGQAGISALEEYVPDAGQRLPVSWSIKAN